VFAGSPTAVPAPDEPVEGVVVVSGVVAVFALVEAVAIGVAAGCAWKPSTAAVPKTVEPMTMGARFI
jgi:hypothetical protein